MAHMLDIWALAFPGDAFALPHERWKSLGLQGTDPTTDLRGAGLVGLQHLQRFLQQQRAVGDAALNDSDGLSPQVALPLSIASINCSAMLLSYLQICPKLACAFLPGGRVECSSDELHGFLGLASSSSHAANAADAADYDADFDGSDDDEDNSGAAGAERLLRALQTMHYPLLLHLVARWRSMCAHPGTTLMDFPKGARWQASCGITLASRKLDVALAAEPLVCACVLRSAARDARAHAARSPISRQRALAPRRRDGRL